jgi:hypothetical protein
MNTAENNVNNTTTCSSTGNLSTPTTSSGDINNFLQNIQNKEEQLESADWNVQHLMSNVVQLLDAQHMSVASSDAQHDITFTIISNCNMLNIAIIERSRLDEQLKSLRANFIIITQQQEQEHNHHNLSALVKKIKISGEDLTLNDLIDATKQDGLVTFIEGLRNECAMDVLRDICIRYDITVQQGYDAFCRDERTSREFFIASGGFDSQYPFISLYEFALGSNYSHLAMLLVESRTPCTNMSSFAPTPLFIQHTLDNDDYQTFLEAFLTHGIQCDVFQHNVKGMTARQVHLKRAMNSSPSTSSSSSLYVEDCMRTVHQLQRAEYLQVLTLIRCPLYFPVNLVERVWKMLA